jgi:hypothetical protein
MACKVSLKPSSLVKIVAITIPVLSCVALVTAYVFGYPAFLAPIFERALTPPTMEEYRAYSAFVDDFFARRPFPITRASHKLEDVLVLGDTVPMVGPSTLDIAVLGAESTTRDFFRQNARSWPLRAELFHTGLRVKMVGHGASAEIQNQPGDTTEGLLSVSRVGFDNTQTKALLYYSYHCGNLCAQSGLVLMRKSGSQWHIQQFGPSVVSSLAK